MMNPSPLISDEESFWLNPEPHNTLPALHFVHGNSFPTGTYRSFLNKLKAHYQLHALDMHGHQSNYPVTDNWTELCKELIASIEIRQHHQPVILVGHSLGGMLSFMVAKMRPDLVRCVVMLDSPVVAGWRATLWRALKLTRLVNHFSPAKYAKKRCISWVDQDAAFNHFVSKPVFSGWPEYVLRDYIHYGTTVHENGVALRFNREIETAIYNTVPHTMGQHCDGHFPVPIGFIAGKQSEECRLAGLEHTHKLVRGNFVEIEGGHLYPLESPQHSAELVHAMIKKLLAT